MDSDPPTRWEFQRFSCLLAGALCPVISQGRLCCGFLPEEAAWLTVASRPSTPPISPASVWSSTQTTNPLATSATHRRPGTRKEAIVAPWRP